MIPRDYITEWRSEAPWVQDSQVEQDLVISRALVEIFSHPLLSKSLAFRGGTALYKLHIRPAARYSEDIDLVQIEAEPAGPVMEALREVLDPWLGKPNWKQSEGRVTFVYRFESEETSPLTLRLKVEINTREHFSVFGINAVPFWPKRGKNAKSSSSLVCQTGTTTSVRQPWFDWDDPEKMDQGNLSNKRDRSSLFLEGGGYYTTGFRVSSSRRLGEVIALARNHMTNTTPGVSDIAFPPGNQMDVAMENCLT